MERRLLMNIKNYTSTVQAETSVSRIEKNLVKSGANNILKTYENGILKGIQFTKELNGNTIAFKIEAKTEKIFHLLMAEFSRPTDVTRRNSNAQAERTAWKLISDWVEIQLSLIALEQVDFMQIFLPYVFDHSSGQTFYNRIKDSGFKLLK